VAPARPGDEVRLVTDHSSLVWPVADSRVIADGGDPASIAEQRSQVRLAFVTMLQNLPARQRAVLLLRDVLRFTAAEVAMQLGATPSAVESALKRARSTMTAMVDAGPTLREFDKDLDLLERYCDAFERGDVDALIGMLHDDVVMEMPPSMWWLQGRPEVEMVLRGSSYCHGDRAIPEFLNGSIAFRQVRGSSTVAHVALDVRDDLVWGVTAYIVGDFLDSILSPPTNPSLVERIRP
jgi:RNA polymerase sigma-70 factor (ECF subfamily)